MSTQGEILNGNILDVISAQQPQNSQQQSTQQQNTNENQNSDFEVVKKWFEAKNIKIEKEDDIENMLLSDEEVKVFNKYKKETGRGLEDFYKMYSISKNIDTVQDSDDLIKQIIKEENPLAQDDDILESIFEKKYKLKSDQDEFLDEDEIKSIKEHNKAVTKNRQEILERYKEKLKQEAEKYKLPSETIAVQEYKKVLKEKFKDFVQSQKYINFAIGDNEVYPFVLDEDTTKNVFITPDEWIDTLKDESGALDEVKLFKSMIIVSNIDKILPIIYNQGVEKGKLKVLEEQTNPSRVQIPQAQATSADIINALFG